MVFMFMGKFVLIVINHFEVSSLTPTHVAGALPSCLMFIVLFKLIDGPSSGLMITSSAASRPALSQSPFK